LKWAKLSDLLAKGVINRTHGDTHYPKCTSEQHSITSPNENFEISHRPCAIVIIKSDEWVGNMKPVWVGIANMDCL